MDRKSQLCAKALDYLLEHGIAGLSLRPLAESIGTSARLLIYHFGSKEGLITAVMQLLRVNTQASFAEVMARVDQDATMKTFWQWCTHPRNTPGVRLLFELQMLALQDPATYGRYLDGTSSSWLDIIESALPDLPQRRTLATLCAAVVDGLVLEYLATGDLARTTAAVDMFMVLLHSANTKGGTSKPRATRGTHRGS